MKERENAIKKKILYKTGLFMTGLGGTTIGTGIATQHGELGSLGSFIGGVGIIIILTGIREAKK